MALTVESATFDYGRAAGVTAPAVIDITVQVAPGELLLVLGATGSGKSTLLRLMSGLLVPSAGRVSLDGEPLDAGSAAGRIGLVFQDAESQLFADNVLDDVAFGPSNLGATPNEARAAAAEALEAVGLPVERFGSRSPFALSGGEARRAAIAGVLAMRPAYLLADEPTAGLDARGRAKVLELIAKVRRTAGIVVVSHSAADMLAIADRVLLLAGGRSAWLGRAEQLVRDPTPFSAAGLIAPDVLEAQRLFALRAEGGTIEFTLDPTEAAQRLAVAGGWKR